MTCNTCYISDIPSGVGGSKSLRLLLVRRARSHTRKIGKSRGGIPPHSSFQDMKGFFMTIHRMRTINESVAIIKEMDEQSAITANCIRTLCKEGKVHCVFTGKKILVDLDALIAFLSGNYQKTA